MILSIETSTPICSVALHNSGKIIAETNLYLDKSHSEKLAKVVQDLLSYAGIKPTELKAIAIASGPGSYTGLRIGAATAKGICYSLNIPLIAINTLMGMAATVAPLAYTNELLCPMLDARRMEVYSMVVSRKLQIIEPEAAKIITEDSYHELVTNQNVLFFGNGVAKCQPILKHYPNARFYENASISASSIGQLAWIKYKKKQFEDLAYFEPNYLKEYKAVKAKSLFA